uniref:Uncharacterized protein n=1 Tax=Spironucleus salmonicida TaxID=348837 RepID=V6LJZ9_9EUKA|eukprot:EST44872.1 Hypothetical protein SS50377_15232 [Spironucleus salmonicida]
MMQEQPNRLTALFGVDITRTVCWGRLVVWAIALRVNIFARAELGLCARNALIWIDPAATRWPQYHSKLNSKDYSITCCNNETSLHPQIRTVQR